MTKRWVFGVLVPFVLLMALACGKGAPTGTEEVPKAEPPAAAAEPVPAEAPEVEPAAAAEPAPARERAEYLGEGVILAGLKEADFTTSGPYYVSFYPATVLTEPSEATKQEGKVRLRDKDEEAWTALVVRSRPAERGDLQVGALVLADFYDATEPKDEESLRAISPWHLWRVKDLSNLHKEMVVLTRWDGYWSRWKEKEDHLLNLRIPESEIPLELKDLDL